MSPLYGHQDRLQRSLPDRHADARALVAADPNCEPMFKPYLRGQDIDRWHAEWAGLWMIALKSSGNHTWPWSRAGRQRGSEFRTDLPGVHCTSKQYREPRYEAPGQGEYWWELRAWSPTGQSSSKPKM